MGELSRRENQVGTSAQPSNASRAQAHNRPLYPIQFATDVVRLCNECTVEDLNVHKPTVKDNLKASITNAYNRSDFEEAKRRQDQSERKLALERFKRREKNS